MRSNARAGPSGMRLPCSRLRSLCTLIPNISCERRTNRRSTTIVFSALERIEQAVGRVKGYRSGVQQGSPGISPHCGGSGRIGGSDDIFGRRIEERCSGPWWIVTTAG